MKKTLGLLALTLAVSSVATAQDFLKSIGVNVSGRYDYTDKNVNKDGTEQNKDGDAKNLGNEGFKQENRTLTRFDKKVFGKVMLSDENGIEADFYVTHRNDTSRDGRKRTDKAIKTMQGLTLSKSTKLGMLDTTWALSYEGDHSRKYNAMTNARTDEVESHNTFKFGPAFTVYGVDVDTKLGYSHVKGTDELVARFADDAKMNRGYDFWTVDLNLVKTGAIAKTGAGDVTYKFEFNNTLQNANYDVAKGDSVSELKLDYIQELKYTTPMYAGFKSSIALNNEWEKNTNVTGWKNTFKIPVAVSYMKSFDTMAGKVTVNPYVSYDVLQRASTYNKSKKDNKRLTKEKNKAVLGLKVELAVK